MIETYHTWVATFLAWPIQVQLLVTVTFGTVASLLRSGWWRGMIHFGFYPRYHLATHVPPIAFLVAVTVLIFNFSIPSALVLATTTYIFYRLFDMEMLRAAEAGTGS